MVDEHDDCPRIGTERRRDERKVDSKSGQFQDQPLVDMLMFGLPCRFGSTWWFERVLGFKIAISPGSIVHVYPLLFQSYLLQGLSMN